MCLWPPSIYSTSPSSKAENVNNQIGVRYGVLTAIRMPRQCATERDIESPGKALARRSQRGAAMT